ncbi:MAG: hypothetical protein AAF498_05040 [Pseudomonadota bacterium]
MLKSSNKTEQDEWLKESDFIAQLADLGVSVSHDQLKAWDKRGLVPSQSPYGRKVYHRRDLMQAKDCAELFRIKRRSKYVGWRLWLLGYEVPEDHWRQHIEAAGKSAKVLKRLPNDLGEADEDQFQNRLYESTADAKLVGPSASAKRRMSPGTVQDALLAIISAALGYESFHPEHIRDDDKFTEVTTLLGMRSGLSHQIGGERMNYRLGVRNMLHLLGGMRHVRVDRDLFRGSGLKELKAARDIFRLTCETSIDTHDSLKWIFGPRAFGFHSVRWLWENAPKNIQAACVLGMVGARYLDAESVYSIAELKELRAQSAKLKSDAFAFKELLQEDKELAAIAGPRKLRKAFPTIESKLKLINKISEIMVRRQALTA